MEKYIYIFYARKNNGRLTCLRSSGVMTQHEGLAGKVSEDRREGKAGGKGRRRQEKEKWRERKRKVRNGKVMERIEVVSNSENLRLKDNN